MGCPERGCIIPGSASACSRSLWISLRDKVQLRREDGKTGEVVAASEELWHELEEVKVAELMNHITGN